MILSQPSLIAISRIINRCLLTLFIVCSILIAPIALFVGIDASGAPSFGFLDKIVGYIVVYLIMFEFVWIPLVLGIVMLASEKYNSFSLLLSPTLLTIMLLTLSYDHWAIVHFLSKL